jgi:hypothetical protein
MSKVKIQGNASGTGVLTITAPNTSTDRTITLPDESVTLGAATPSITDNGDATAITIDSNENVGIAVTPESGWSTKVMQLGRTSIGAGNDATGGQMNWNAYYDGNWKYKDSLEATRYAMNNAHTFQVAASGSANGAITWTTGFEVLGDGKARAKNGLLFGTDTTTANTLDDYEEGTFTPTILIDGSTTGTTQDSGNQGAYTKIGNTVICDFTVGLTNKGSETGNITIGGLPFTIANSLTSTSIDGGSISWGFSTGTTNSNDSNGINRIYGAGWGGTSYAVLYKRPANEYYGHTDNYLNHGGLQTACSFRGSITFKV